MRRFAVLISLFIPALAYSQTDTTLRLPMKGGVVFYEKTTALPSGIKAKDLEKRFSAWVVQSFPEAKTIDLQIHSEKDRVAAKGLIKVIVNDQNQFYLVNFAITLIILPDSWTLQASDFFEKPTFPGTTNDWSKIEYRWRDYRRGKPWASTDTALLRGIDLQVKSWLESFGK